MDRPLYVVPFRVVVGARLGVLVLGALGGALGAWLTLKALLRVNPQGERVIERVERVTVAAEDALASAAATMAPHTVALMDASGRTLRHAIAVTTDGVLVGVGAAPRGDLKAQRLSGDVLPVSVVRSYPEAGVFFLRASGSFSVPEIERDLPLPGSSLAAVALAQGGEGPRVQVVTVEATTFGGRVLASYPALVRMPLLGRALPPSFLGTPLVGTDGRLRGLSLVERDGTYLIPGSVIEFLLQDFLRNADEASVSLLQGVRGQWREERRDDQRTHVFRVRDVAANTPFEDAGLRSGDDIRGVHGISLSGELPLFSPLLGAVRGNTSVILNVRRGTDEVTAAVSPVVR